MVSLPQPRSASTWPRDSPSDGARSTAHSGRHSRRCCRARDRRCAWRRWRPGRGRTRPARPHGGTMHRLVHIERPAVIAGQPGHVGGIADRSADRCPSPPWRAASWRGAPHIRRARISGSGIDHVSFLGHSAALLASIQLSKMVPALGRPGAVARRASRSRCPARRCRSDRRW